jgi:hypothetical protein
MESFATARPEGKLAPVESMKVLRGAPGLQTVLPPSVETDRPTQWQSPQDRTRVFLHQLSQALTSLRGALELALLLNCDEPRHRTAIQQSLVQAEGLVQVFKSYRATTEAEAGYINAEQVGLGDVVRMALQQLRPITDSRALRVHMESGDHCAVPIQPARLLAALRRALLCAVQLSPRGAELEVAISCHGKSACLTLSATRQGPETSSLTGFGKIAEQASTKGLAGELAERNWASMRTAIKAVGGSILKITTETFALLCEIRIPISRPR